MLSNPEGLRHSLTRQFKKPVEFLVALAGLLR